MIVHLTDAQLSRVLELCEKVSMIRHTLPAPPLGMETDLELARGLRASLEKVNDVLLELGALLR